LSGVDENNALELSLLGAPQLVMEGRDRTSEIGAKALALMAFLSMSAPTRLPRAKVASTFWADKSEEASRYRLRHTLWELRRVLGKAHLQSDDAACWFSMADGAWVDVRHFEDACREFGVGTKQRDRTTEQLQEFDSDVALYRGDLLDGLAVHEAPMFEDWLLVERERLQLLYLEAQWCLARAQIAIGELVESIQTLTRLIEADPLRERSYRALIGAHLRRGDRSAALRVYQQCSRTLAAELGVAPSPRTQQLREAIVQDTPTSSEAELRRAADLLQQGLYAAANAACVAAEEMATDVVTTSQVGLLRAEIAVMEGNREESAGLIKAAREALQALFSR
jgi:DNA-binding SARP family transcriptional activator